MRITGFVGLLSLMLLPGFAAAQTVWDMPTEYPASAIPGEGVAAFADAVTKGSGGSLTIRPSFDAALGLKSAQMLAAVQDGKVTVADAFGGALGGVHPAFALSSQPFLATSIADARALASAARPFYEKTLAGFGQRLLYTTPWPPSGIWSKAAILSEADVKALRIRTYDATSSTVLGAAGAAASNLSFADVMPKLKDGSITAILSSGDGGAGRKLWEFLPHFSEINYALPLSFATINLAAYNALTPDLRAVIDKAAAETEARQWQAINTRLAENYSRMRANQVIITSPAPPEVMAALKAAASPAIDKWAAEAGPEGQAVLKAFRAR